MLPQQWGLTPGYRIIAYIYIPIASKVILDKTG